MDKSPDAFRTISEVAEALETPSHVLRFWETRFPQIKPVKRAGGRRYYRPADVALLGGIRHLLHDEGMTIRGVQKILREQGVRHVAAMGPGGDLTAFDALDAEEDFVLNQSVSGEVPVETGQILAMEPQARRASPLPETPAEVVQLRLPVEVPDLSQGFMLPTANRRPLATLDPAPPLDDVPEAGHVWVEDDGPEEVEALPLFPVEAAIRGLEALDGAGRSDRFVLAPEAVQQDLFANLPPAADPDMSSTEKSPELADAAAAAAPAVLAGMAARLRALPRPVSAQTAVALSEVQMRLGLLHAQMVEAQRLRR